MTGEAFALVGGLALNAGALVWFGGRMSAKLDRIDALEKQVAALDKLVRSTLVPVLVVLLERGGHMSLADSLKTFSLPVTP